MAIIMIIINIFFAILCNRIARQTGASTTDRRFVTLMVMIPSIAFAIVQMNR